MHWGSPENLSDVTHPFLNFSLSPIMVVCLSRALLMVLALFMALMEILCDLSLKTLFNFFHCRNFSHTR